ncbi:MAG: UDP-N-acetylmuramoyl-tripeptide--D-alanyl-D-alanine ligase [Oscillospiraceae bacterium]|nr:UDP-N-acetylmuramoyl-tripeptide--D-alanyl-D-alanine ligase [Oscillospiraceae bacterium]
MEALPLNRLAQAVGAQCASERPVESICTDTRKIKEGSLFIAIRGDRFDGHDFIEQAYQKGAAGVITSRPVPGREGVILVPDTRKALLDLARYYRGLFRVFMVGITGSVGKTSTKEMVAAILGAKGKTLKTEGNLNNEIGMPMTMFNLDSSYQNAVMEMGMSGFGEISALTGVCVPNVGIITNIGVSHMEALGSRENILRAKLEITDSMSQDAPLILNGDNDLLRTVPDLTEHPIIYYGFEDGDVTASDLSIKGGSTCFTIHFYGRTIQASVPAVGKHNVYNALAGFCAGMVADMDPEQIVRAMRLYRNAGLRQKQEQVGGVTVIADCYNASPDSMRAALDVITSMECAGKRYCVFGDMLELGDLSEESHLEVGRMVARSRVDGLLCYGERARDIKRGAMMVGMKQVKSFQEPQELAAWLGKHLKPGDAVIYKASRGMRLEEVAELVNRQLQAESGDEE